MRIIIIIIIAHLKRPAESGLSQDELQHADHRGALATGGQGQGQRSRSPTHTQRHSHAFTYTHANSLTHNPLTHKHPPTLKLTYTDSHTIHTYIYTHTNTLHNELLTIETFYHTHTQRHLHAFTHTHANSLTHNPLTHKHPPTLKLTYTDSHTVHTYHTYKHTR